MRLLGNNLLFTRPFQFEDAPSGSLFLQLVDHVQDSFEKQNGKVDIRYDSLACKVTECFFLKR